LKLLIEMHNKPRGCNIGEKIPQGENIMISGPRKSHRHPGLLLMMLIGLIWIRPASAQVVVRVTVEGKAPVLEGNREKARNQAIQAAERNAVAQALASEITVDALLVNLRLSGSILGAIPYGKIVQKKILDEGLIKSTTGDDAAGQGAVYRIRMRAGVVRETEGVDPSFYLDAGINQSVFKDGDTLEIHIRSTKNCYLFIFNILEGRKIIRLFPNSLTENNYLPADKKYIFPDSGAHKKGISLRVHLPENKETVTESIYILATLQPLKLKSVHAQEAIFGVFNGQTAVMQDLIREVANIPFVRRAEAFMQYEIQKEK
jgi:hypothetical protein